MALLQITAICHCPPFHLWARMPNGGHLGAAQSQSDALPLMSMLRTSLALCEVPSTRCEGGCNTLSPLWVCEGSWHSLWAAVPARGLN